MKKLIAVIGLGRFGTALATELSRRGSEVLGVDINANIVNEMSETLTYCVQADCTDENTVHNLGLNTMDIVVVSIGEIHSSVMVVLFLKEMGVPYVIAKATNDIHSRLLMKVGVDRVVFPEKDMGVRMAHSLMNPSAKEYIELSGEYGMIECAVPRAWADKSLKDLAIRNKYNVNIMGIRDKSGKLNITPDADRPLLKSDILVILGDAVSLEKLEREMQRYS